MISIKSIRLDYLEVSLVLFFFTMLTSCNPEVSHSSKDFGEKMNHEYDVAAYIWPSCHHDERLGDTIWPEGTGEWEVIKKATPVFEGHYQPKVPLWGYEPDDDPKVMERWIDAALDHGVNVFIFDWYWLDDGPFLENSLNNGFLKAENNEKMKFFVMWANHNMPAKLLNVYKEDLGSLQWDGAVDMENFKIIVARVINQYFKRPNYYQIDGKPVFSLFLINEFIRGMGGLDEAAAAMDYFRDETKKAGFPGLHLQQIVFGSPGQEILKSIEALGVNSVTKYNWWASSIPEDYIRWGVENMERRKEWDEALSIPFFPNVSVGWDNSPRFLNSRKEHIVHLNKSPVAFSSFLQKAKEYCNEHPEQPKLITLFAWNEWIEGSYLLPDIKYGFSYLEAVKNVMSNEYNNYGENVESVDN